MQLLSTAQAFDFTQFDYTQLAWKRLVIAARGIERKQYEEYTKASSIAFGGVFGASDLEFDARQKFVQKQLDKLHKTILPWLNSQTYETDTMLDDIAKWYAVMAPDAEVEA